jgi:hypothetical protein
LFVLLSNTTDYRVDCFPGSVIQCLFD